MRAPAKHGDDPQISTITVGEYLVELDGTCATLVCRHISRKTGEPYWRPVGYFPDAAQALARLLDERLADARDRLTLEQTRDLILEVREDILQAVRHQKPWEGTAENIAEDASGSAEATNDGEPIPQYGSEKLVAFLGLTDSFGFFCGKEGE